MKVGEVDLGSARLLAMVNFVGDMFTYSQLGYEGVLRCALEFDGGGASVSGDVQR